jgi:hypothetical protein
MHSHQKHNKQAASHRRAAQFMKENACGGAIKKKHGGALSRGNDRAMVMAKGQKQDAVSEDISAEGRGSKHRIAKKRGGGIKNVNIHIHPRPHVMLPAQGVTAGGPMMQAAGPAPMAGPGPGLPPPGMAPGQPHMNQGGSVNDSYGAASGMSRKAEYERMRREGH